MRLFKFSSGSKRLINIVGLKFIYQIAYILFNLVIVKKLAIAEYGAYAYLTAIIVYFSSVPMLGLPIYLQRNIAKQHHLNYKYFVTVAFLVSTSLVIAYHAIPPMAPIYKFITIMIIVTNCLLAVPVPVNDGIGNFAFQYKLLFLSSVWMIACIIEVVFLKHTMTFYKILDYWFLNSLFTLVILIYILKKLMTALGHLFNASQKAYPLVLLDLVLTYAVCIPDAFSKFYDRFLAHHLLGDVFLGNYSFNFMIVATLYALFIRPINSVLFTELSQSSDSSLECIQVIKKYYLYGLAIYLVCFLCYLPLSSHLLALLGLSKFIGTTSIFSVCFINAVLYFLSTPFTCLITLGENGKKKLIYCVTSMAIFNIPMLLLFIRPTQNIYYIGFILAYSLNLLFSLFLKRDITVHFFQSILHDLTYIKRKFSTI